MSVAKIIFILFANGMLHVCERIQNPLDNRTSSLSRHLHGKWFYVYAFLSVHSEFLVDFTVDYIIYYIVL
jgi:hypothetical protein